MRVSDIERQRAVEELRRHCAAGRLDVDEYAHRIEQVLSATTLEEIDKVLADLPMVRIADPVQSTPRVAAGAIVEARSAGSHRPSARLAATAVVVLTVLLVVAVVVLATLASWAWAAVLVAGWLLGLAQARFVRRRS